MNNSGNFYKGKKILITGHTGFKGSWLSQILLNKGARVSGIALEPPTTPSLFNLLGLENSISHHLVDIRDFIAVKDVITKEKPEIIFHLAAQPIVRASYDDPLYTFETNVMGTANVLQAVKEISGVKAVVIVATDKVYENKELGHPFKENDKLGGYDPYSGSKAAAELVTESYIKSFFNPTNYNINHQTLIASARSGNVIGGGDWQKDRLIPDIIRSIFEKEESIVIRQPNAIRPWQYVLDSLFGYILLAEKLYEGKAEFSRSWNFGPNDNNYLTVNEVVKKALGILKKGSYLVKEDMQKYETGLLKLNSDDARNILLWQSFVNSDEILKLTFEWYKSFYEGGNVIEITNQQIESFFNKAICTADLAIHQ